MLETVLILVALMLIGVMVGVFVAIVLINSWMDRDD
jgi:hypothetical protein